MKGVSCFDCHVNGHTSAAIHLVGDIRPQSHRRRIETTSLRGVNIQRLFGSQRALKTIEDFTEFEQRAGREPVCNPIQVEGFSLDPELLRGWRSPQRSAYRGMHGSRHGLNAPEGVPPPLTQAIRLE